MSNVRLTRRLVSDPSPVWAAPTLTTPNTYTITSASASRLIVLAPGEDAIIQSPAEISFVGGTFNSQVDAVVTIVGGRNIVWEGARFNLTGGPVTVLDVAATGTQTNLVADTTGFPDAGFLRIEGELVRYTSKTITQFNVDLRDAGFYNGTTPANLSHPAGATVYLGEYARTPISFRNQTGEIWLKDMQASGFINDGIRLNCPATVVTLQDIRIGPVSCHDTVGMTDGHPDCIQVWEVGPTLIRIARATLMAGGAGRCLWDFPSTTPTGAWDLRDVELIDSLDAVNGLMYGQTPTLWNSYNCWLRTRKRRVIASDVTQTIAADFNMSGATDAGPDFVPAS